MASGKASVGVDWGRLGRNDERIEIVRLSGEKAGETEVVGPGLWPRFAPTDDRLAWIGRDRTSWDVYVRSADRLTLSRLTNDPAQDSQPIWRPDGSAVVFLSNRVNRWDLYECPATGGPIRRLTKHPRREDSPTLSPDGTRVAFTNENGRGQAHIQLLDLASETAVDLLPDPLDDREPCWSPDGQSIAFASRRTSPER
jgi:Tol biopolymer transport system component